MKPGMKVSVKLDAMPFQEFGGLDGELIYVSNDTFNESVSGDQGGICEIRNQRSLPYHYIGCGHHPLR